MSEVSGGEIMWPEDANPESARAYEKYVRERHHVGGPTVFDFTLKNNLLSAQGETAFHRELEGTLPADRLSQLKEVCAEVHLAFKIRTEFINMKKVILHLLADTMVIELSLRRQSTFFFTDTLPLGGLESWDDVEKDHGSVKMPFRLGERYAAISSRLNHCRGAIAALRDWRNLTKSLVCIPRHRDGEWPSVLVDFPKGSGVYRLILDAISFLEGQCDMDCMEQKQLLFSVSERRPSFSKYKDLCDKVKDLGWPQVVVDYVLLATHARGVFKSLSIHEEATRLEHMVGTVSAVLQRVREKVSTVMTAAECEAKVDNLVVAQSTRLEGQGADAAERVSRGVTATKHAAALEGSGSILSDFHLRLKNVCKGLDDRGFSAGDSARDAGAFFTPPDFEPSRLVQQYRISAEEYGSVMNDVLESEGWPRHIVIAAECPSAKAVKCRICSTPNNRIWLTQGVCWPCERRERAAGRCPLRSACKQEWFCSHRRMCLRCERRSCSDCRIICGDGSEVGAVMKNLMESCAVFLDFDLTLCSTKNGGSPLQGSHSIDEGLGDIARHHVGPVLVVTRNSHHDSITEFLTEQHDIQNVKVHCVKAQRQSKADVILPVLDAIDGEGIKGVFIDDDIKELLDPRLTECTSLLRILFRRD